MENKDNITEQLTANDLIQLISNRKTYAMYTLISISLDNFFLTVITSNTTDKLIFYFKNNKMFPLSPMK